ncbi:uncharacterized protein LOC116108778 [Pistacia vera]|uniref:uncharacterized protein LOC116108778 n=1 Tax=Pistacia vera TaxID=55513 RepID=UPI001262D81B|nr:uncharacterized protein LOC116108778 [Pistacia vera]
MDFADAEDKNVVFSPCDDAKVKRFDGFTLGLAFSAKESFFLDQTQLSPCDSRLNLVTKPAQLAVFRPRVDEISLLTIENPTFNPNLAGGFVVAFAGRKYAARSVPQMISDIDNIVTTLTLVLEFHEGTLQNLHWKSFGCDSCGGDAGVCLNNTVCAVPNTKCKKLEASADCKLSIQLTFSGTDESREVLNSWYEVENLRKFSLFDLYANVRDAMAGMPN